MPGRLRSVRRARRQPSSGLRGYVVTWDVDSKDAGMCARVRRFIFGYSLGNDGRRYRYPGFVEKDGVRYLGQSVLFVAWDRLDELRSALRALGVEHVVTDAWIGSIMPS